MKFSDIVGNSTTWFLKTPDRALEGAYKAALKIKSIEDDFFQGQKVSPLSPSDYSDSVVAYFQGEVKKYIQVIEARLREFKFSRFLLTLTEINVNNSSTESPNNYQVDLQPRRSNLEKIQFIDEIITKYKTDPSFNHSFFSFFFGSESNNFPDREANNGQIINKQLGSLETVSDKTSVLPRSFWNTVNKIKKDVNPHSENTETEVLKKYRQSRQKTIISMRFILVLLLVPIFVYQISKNFIFIPIVEQYFQQHEQILFLNQDTQEEALMELHQYKESLHFEGLLGISSEISPEKIQAKVQEKANQIAEDVKKMGVDSVANIFADLLAFATVAIVIFRSKRTLVILKSFFDEIFYGLSDSAKAFLIILISDIFVGYHSPHGWEIILESVAHHLGLPENRNFNGLFIATFPVILDTVLKYWIFRYLNRISPSSVATYKNMNE